MKKKLPSFLSGFLCAILLVSLTVGVYAASEWPKTIEVGHINIMVNGKEFQPTDSKGRPVDVFVYKGTTYAPLRALAEAYGLTVGYDAGRNMATVTAPGSSTQTQPVQPSIPTVRNYSAYPSVPDFGSLFNVLCDRTFSNDDTTMYLYNVSRLPSGCTITYGDYIHDRGFRFLGEFPDSYGNTVLAFSNGIYGVSIGTMWVDNAGYIAIMITQD